MKYIEKYWNVIVIVFILSMFFKPAFCFSILGSLALYVGIKGIFFFIKMQKKGIESTGKILSFQSGNKGYKTPIVEFTPTGGELIKEKPFVYASTDLSRIRSYKNMIDQQVSIFYDPDDPRKFILADENGFNYFANSFSILIGLIFIIISISMFLGHIKIR